MLKKKFIKFLNLKLINFSVATAIYLIHPAHAGHLQKLLPQSQLQKIQRQYDKETIERFSAWDHLLQSSKDKSTIEKLHLVNDFFNQMKWTDDKELWDSRDYWATPIESLIRNAGDCEDFSIAKYFTLLELGVSVNQLKISYVKIMDLDQSHMVLAYYPSPDADPLIMDNMKSEILKTSQRSDLKLMFNFNNNGIWSQKAPFMRMDAVTKIRHWSELVKRMSNEQG